MGTEEDLLVFIWSSGPLEFYDASPDLQPFSYFQYRVQAQNSKGSVLSQWASARTLQARPANLPAPSATPTGEFAAITVILCRCRVSYVDLCAAVPHAVLTDRCVLSSSELERTGTAQRCDFPLQTGIQKTPTGPNAELICCHGAHCGGKELNTGKLSTTAACLDVCLLSSSRM